MENCCERVEEHELAVLRAKENRLAEEDMERVCGVFRMLAEPSRMKLVLALMQGQMCVYHLAEVAEGSVSAVSHQLKLLREQKIVKTTRLGKNIEYSIADEHVLKIVQMALQHLTCATDRKGV